MEAAAWALGAFDAVLRQRLSLMAFAAVAVAWIGYELQVAHADVLRDEAFVFDWDAYMEQAAVVEGGERNYSRVRGDTGALVYPAGHVAIHIVMRRAFGWDTENWTTEFKHSLDSKPAGYEHRTHRPDEVMRRIQILYVGLYGASLAVAACLYRIAGVSWVWLPVLSMGRRLRNIYGLGLFNDVWAMLFAHTAVLAAGTEHWTAATLLFSLGLSVKMNVLLFLPAYGALVLVRRGWKGVVYHGALGAAVQVVLGAPFLVAAPAEYVAAAFNLGRLFTHRWSINWQHVPVDAFSAPWFRQGLLGFHIALLLGVALSQKRSILAPNGRLAGAGIVRTLVLCNFLGIIAARSLHYQFFAWYALTLPIVGGTTRVYLAMVVPVVLLLEKVWNVHEPEPWSAAVLSACHLALAAAQVVAPRVAPDVRASAHRVAARIRSALGPVALFEPR